jgi:uncharacterized protein DUF4136
MFWRTLVTVWLVVCPAVVMAETRVDVNRHKNFSQYKTFTLEVNAPVRDGEVDENNTIAENRLRRAITNELQMHGLRLVDSGADLTVRAGSRETERTELMSSGYPYGWYGPWGYGYGGYWGAPWGGDVWTYRYLEGTTKIDVIEGATGDLVYRAEVTRKVDDDEEDLDHDAMRIAHKAFKKFPVRGVFVDD